MILHPFIQKLHRPLTHQCSRKDVRRIVIGTRVWLQSIKPRGVIWSRYCHMHRSRWQPLSFVSRCMHFSQHPFLTMLVSLQ